MKKLTKLIFLFTLFLTLGSASIHAQAASKTYYLLGNTIKSQRDTGGEAIYKGSKIVFSGKWRKSTSTKKLYDAEFKTFKKSIKLSKNCKFCSVSARGVSTTTLKKIVKSNKMKKGDSIFLTTQLQIKVKKGKIVEIAAIH
ncbi:MAG: hypothetical protein Q4D51_05805 [Eubacteriales bacterium]|nr:hypothetical protein [Eubacteriales bacterium]